MPQILGPPSLGREGHEFFHTSILRALADTRAGLPAAVRDLGPDRFQTGIHPTGGHFGPESVFWERERRETTDTRGQTVAQRGNSQMLRLALCGNVERCAVACIKLWPTMILLRCSADWKVRARHLLPKLRNIAALTIKTMVRMKRMPGYVGGSRQADTFVRSAMAGVTSSCVSAAPCVSSSCCPSSRSPWSVYASAGIQEGSRSPWWTTRRQPGPTADCCCPSWTTPACIRYENTIVYLIKYMNEMVDKQMDEMKHVHTSKYIWLRGSKPPCCYI